MEETFFFYLFIPFFSLAFQDFRALLIAFHEMSLHVCLKSVTTSFCFWLSRYLLWFGNMHLSCCKSRCASGNEKCRRVSCKEEGRVLTMCLHVCRGKSLDDAQEQPVSSNISQQLGAGGEGRAANHLQCHQWTGKQQQQQHPLIEFTCSLEFRRVFVC